MKRGSVSHAGEVVNGQNNRDHADQEDRGKGEDSPGEVNRGSNAQKFWDKADEYGGGEDLKLAGERNI